MGNISVIPRTGPVLNWSIFVSIFWKCLASKKKNSYKIKKTKDMIRANIADTPGLTFLNLIIAVIIPS